MKIQKNWFTLIEMIISISIFSIILVSIMSVYFITTNITYKSYANRIIHENIKNIIINISEDVMKNGIDWASNTIGLDCSLPSLWTNDFIKWDKFCTPISNYYLARKNPIWEWYIRADSSFCEKKENSCYIVKNWSEALNNDLVKIEKLNFIVTNKEVKKVTISLSLKPSKKSGVNPSIIKNTKLNTQITLSERLYKK